VKGMQMVANFLSHVRIVNFLMENMLFLISCRFLHIFLIFPFLILGCVIEGMRVIQKIENVPVALNKKLKIPVIISQCGEI
jgi:hypothetical protein